jgi:hypothetical protein
MIMKTLINEDGHSTWGPTSSLFVTVCFTVEKGAVFFVSQDDDDIIMSPKQAQELVDGLSSLLEKAK